MTVAATTTRRKRVGILGKLACGPLALGLFLRSRDLGLDLLDASLEKLDRVVELLDQIARAAHDVLADQPVIGIDQVPCGQHSARRAFGDPVEFDQGATGAVVGGPALASEAVAVRHFRDAFRRAESAIDAGRVDPLLVNLASLAAGRCGEVRPIARLTWQWRSLLTTAA